MLEECAPGHEVRRAKDALMVWWNGKTYRLPSGRHGRIETADIGTSQVRTMVGILEIPAKCAARMLPKLARSFKRFLPPKSP